MTAAKLPKVSFIVLSYNYENLIGIALKSILDQTVQDFEVVVVDDASTDRSCEVIRGFNDPRIRLIVNDQNLGGAGSYNRAVENARGEFLVNLDADDWIVPNKTAIQLERMHADPQLDILGTHVAMVDIAGEPHRDADRLEPLVNTPLDLNLVSTWVMQNPLCRSSTMIRHSAHRKIGLDDPTMVRAPDYELWTRALRMGCRFDVVPLPLTNYRVHGGGVTHADLRGTFLELCYCLLHNLLPLADARALYPTLSDALHWVVGHEQLPELTPAARYALVAYLCRGTRFSDYAAFRDALFTASPDRDLLLEGRRIFAALRMKSNEALVSRLLADIEQYIKAKEYWRDEADKWRVENEYWMNDAQRWRAEYEYWAADADRWRAACEHSRADVERTRAEYESAIAYTGELKALLAKAAPMLAGGRRAQLVRFISRGLGFR